MSPRLAALVAAVREVDPSAMVSVTDDYIAIDMNIWSEDFHRFEELVFGGTA